MDLLEENNPRPQEHADQKGENKMENIIYTGSVAKMIEEDNYDHGILLNGKFADFGIIADHFRAGSIRKLLEKIADFFGISADDMEYDDCNNCFVWDKEENDAGEEASRAEMERFKAGKINLWAARYSCEVRRVSEVAADEMRAAFGKKD